MIYGLYKWQQIIQSIFALGEKYFSSILVQVMQLFPLFDTPSAISFISFMWYSLKQCVLYNLFFLKSEKRVSYYFERKNNHLTKGTSLLHRIILLPAGMKLFLKTYNEDPICPTGLNILIFQRKYQTINGAMKTSKYTKLKIKQNSHKIS